MKRPLCHLGLAVGVSTLLCLLGLMRPAPAAAAATTTTTIQTIFFEAFIEVPCALDGAGEIVHTAGDIQMVAHVTIDEQGKVHANFLFHPQGLTGTGLTSGDTYHFTGETRFNFDPAGPAPVEQTFVNNFKVIGPGPGNNILFHDLIHVTINANGTVTASIDNHTAECR